MRKIITIVFVLIINHCLYSQKQANIWYFGNNSGLDFNQLPPTVLTNSGHGNSIEGCATMSDNNGKLLFYTNGKVVINKQHEVMKNGTYLNGHLSSTNNVLIVPLPGNDSIYYVFTTGAALEETHQFRYSIVNMRGDGGLGEVTDKNIFVEEDVFEKIAGVRHCNNRDAWIVVHKWNTDEYHTYQLTASGFNAVPVISHTGRVISGFENNEIGALKFSRKGDKLAAVNAFDYNSVELMDFDNTTGMISNPLVFKPSLIQQFQYTGMYGDEFSPDGRLLYVSAKNTVDEPCVLYQFDITAPDASSILATKQIITVIKSWVAGALQMGPDGKIYMAMYKDTSLSVIENPDVYGTGCNFKYNKIFMGPLGKEPVQFGLPTFLQSYFYPQSNPYDFSRAGNCSDSNVTFTINRLPGIDSVKWDFGDGQSSQTLQPVHKYLLSGFYDVKLIVYKTDCSGLNDTITRKIWFAGETGFLGKDTSSCDILSLQLGVEEVYGVNYLWNTGAASSKITTYANGLYWLEMEQNGCRIRDSVNVFTKPKPFVSLGNDTTLCLNKPVVLQVNTTAPSVLWNTGETTRSITVKNTGIYYATVTENLCTATDTIRVGTGDCDFYIPSAFSPNDDGINDKFGVLNSFSLRNFSMKIYDRYGHVIFASQNVTDRWDGKLKGKKMPDGVYTWQIIYINGLGYTKWLKGSVLLIH